MRFRRRSLRADLPFLCPVPGMTSFFDGRPRSHGAGHLRGRCWVGCPAARERGWAAGQYTDMETERPGAGADGITVPGELEAAFRLYFPPVYRFIARRVGSALAED